MKFEPFEMERWQSTHEHHVELNLSDSGVHPLTVRELLGDDARADALLDERLVYTQTNGTPELRARIAALHPGARGEHVLVTSGGAEANLLAALTLVDPGDEVVVMLPNYMQLWGIVRALGAEARGWSLVPDHEAGRWTVDLAALEELVTPRTKLIALCNPNNPTGARVEARELDAICALAERVGAWVLADEIYQGSDLDGATTPSVHGRGERVVVTNSLSKTYGLPGLRLGWLVGPDDVVEAAWARHDYTTIAPNALSDRLARHALEPGVRARLLARTRALLTRNYGVLAAWLARNADRLTYFPPAAGAMLYLHYAHPIGSSALAERLRVEQGVLLVPGDHYGMDGWLRIGFGGETAHVERGLACVQELLASLS
jgi:hypothetical protein